MVCSEMSASLLAILVVAQFECLQSGHGGRLAIDSTIWTSTSEVGLTFYAFLNSDPGVHCHVPKCKFQRAFLT